MAIRSFGSHKIGALKAQVQHSGTDTITGISYIGSSTTSPLHCEGITRQQPDVLSPKPLACTVEVALFLALYEVKLLLASMLTTCESSNSKNDKDNEFGYDNKRG